MFWQDQAVVVQQRPFSERKWLVTLLTQDHGLCKGIVRSGALKGWILGAQTDVVWEGMGENSLGRFVLEPAYGPVPLLTHMPGVLSTVSIMCLLCASFLPERVSMPGVYVSFLRTLALLPTARGLEAYNDFEAYFLEELGYGHDASAQGQTFLDALFHRRHVFRKYWPDHSFLDKQRMAFLHDLRCNFQRGAQ